MKKILGMMLVLCMLCSTGLAEGVRIVAHGQGQVTTEPDLFMVTANVSSRAPTAAAAQQQVAASVHRIQEELEKTGLAPSDVVTTGYDCTPAYETEGERMVPSGYEANHVLSITCYDLELMDQVITIATSDEGTTLYGITFDTSLRRELYKQALALAMSAAEEKAGALSTAAGCTDYTILEVEEKEGYYYDNAVTAKEEAAGLAVSTGIRSGSINVSASVTLTCLAQ